MTKPGQVRKPQVLIVMHSCETYHYFLKWSLIVLFINKIPIPLKVSMGLEETLKFLSVFLVVFFETGFVVYMWCSDIMQ